VNSTSTRKARSGEGKSDFPGPRCCEDGKARGGDHSRQTTQPEHDHRTHRALESVSTCSYPYHVLLSVQGDQPPPRVSPTREDAHTVDDALVERSNAISAGRAPERRGRYEGGQSLRHWR